MTWHWLLQMAVNGVATCAGWLLCLYLFLSLKREMRCAGLRASSRQDAMADEIAALKRTVEWMGEELRDNTRRAELLVEPPRAASGLNITKRSQALRMHRRGETPANIAASLGMPQFEVDLLLKVEQIGAGKD